MRSMSVASMPNPMTFTLPKPNDAFRWVQAPAGPALVCRPLEAVAVHLFTTRAWPIGSRSDAAPNDGWSEVGSALGVGPEHLVRVRQVHGASTVVASAPAVTPPPEGDIILSADPRVAVAVQAAD